MAAIHFHETAHATPERVVEALTDFGSFLGTVAKGPW